MTNHPIHLHGVEFEVTGTDGGPTPKGFALAGGDHRHRGGADAPDRFLATEEGDWAFHSTRAITP